MRPVVARAPSGSGRVRFWRGALGIALLAACGERESRPARAPRVPLVSEAALALPYASPARLRYHPRQRGRTLSEQSLPDGRRLLVGERGERWLLDATGQSLTAGAVLAPETLIAALRDQETIWFVGESGTSYAAPGPLAPFERSTAPSEALSGVSAAGTTIVGVRQTQALLRSPDYGLTWAPVGPEGVRFVGVALSPSGSGLALAVPEALYRTGDFGATWQPLSASTVGALELEVASEGRLNALTPLGVKRLELDSAGVQALAPLTAASGRLPPPPRGPDAGALAEGRAVLAGKRYLELTRGGDGWQLLAGPLEGPFESTRVREANGCRAVRLAAHDRFVAFACFRGSVETTAQPVELYLSNSSGRMFERVEGRLDATLGAFSIAIGADGRWIVSGTCPPGTLAAGCSPAGIQYPRSRESEPPRNAAARLALRAAGAPSAAPSLTDAALALAFSPDGRTAYAVGRRTKTGSFALFVSRDAGQSFRPEQLDLGQLASDEGDDEFVERSPGTRVESLSAADDGAVAIGFVHYGRRTLVVTDERGKLLSASAPPEERGLVGASGLRALAVNAKSRQVWESLDGGVTWDPAQALPIDACPGDDACEIPVRCGPHACVLGAELTRVGWGKSDGHEGTLLLPPLRPMRTPSSRRVASPIACTLEPGPFRALPGVDEAPSASESAIGAVSWYVVADDVNRASVTVYHASKGRLEPVRLLEPTPRAEEHAYAVINQVEGVAALRYRLPEAVPGRTNLTDVEVSWNDVLHGRVVRARLPDGGAHAPGDFVQGRGRARRAEPELVSIAEGGLYLRLHNKRREQATLFLDGKRVETIAPVPWSLDERYPAREEIVRTDGAHSPVLLVGRGAAVVRAHGGPGGYRYDAYATGLIDPAKFGLVQVTGIAYVGNRAGLHLETQESGSAASTGRVFPFRGSGPVLDPPTAVPTQHSLGDRPRACGAEDKRRTPRIVASVQAGTRHPVIVTDSIEGPRTLLTGSAVVHGTPAEPCAASFDALGVPSEGNPPPRESALILLDDLQHSVLFRVAGERENARIEHRTMSCRFDPSVEVPPDVYRALGANGG